MTDDPESFNYKFGIGQKVLRRSWPDRGPLTIKDRYTQPIYCGGPYEGCYNMVEDRYCYYHECDLLPWTPDYTEHERRERELHQLLLDREAAIVQEQRRRRTSRDRVTRDLVFEDRLETLMRTITGVDIDAMADSIREEILQETDEVVHSPEQQQRTQLLLDQIMNERAEQAEADFLAQLGVTTDESVTIVGNNRVWQGSAEPGQITRQGVEEALELMGLAQAQVWDGQGYVTSPWATWIANRYKYPWKHSDVKNLAHRLWEEAGRPDGRDKEFWYKAEKEVQKRTMRCKGESGACMTDHEKAKEFAIEQFIRRKKQANIRGIIDNSSMPCNSPMMFYCEWCGILVEILPEDYLFSPRKRCSQCKGLMKAGWLQAAKEEAERQGIPVPPVRPYDASRDSK